MSKQGRVLVAMSGGIDSSLTAFMLHQQGYQVIGITMKTWDYASTGGSKKETGCCSLDSINDARQMAVDMGFPHYILDIRQNFGEHIIDYFKSEYLNGRTPNPCVMCNTHIKWDVLLKKADMLNCDYIATGHYAKIGQHNDRFFIQKAKDDNKDQSYVLWGVQQESLARTLFPLGNYTKPEVRQLAAQEGFTELAKKSESYEICFVPENNYRNFLKNNVDGLEEQVKGGTFVNEKGEKIGEHEGYPFYTIGQRKGLGIATGDPVYVLDIKKERNEVVIGPKAKLEKRGLSASKLNLLKYSSLEKPLDNIKTKIRYKDTGTTSCIWQEGESVYVKFKKPVAAIAPGQAAVFYEGDDVIGGGWIDKALDF